MKILTKSIIDPHVSARLHQLAEEYYSSSPYSFVSNSPLFNLEIDGRFWIPKVNEDGSTSYIAQEGDSAETLATQYGLKQSDAEAITNTEGDAKIEESTEVSGKTVNIVTKSEVLKLKDYSDKQRNLDHLAFAFRHDESKDNIFKITDYFKVNQSTPTSLTIDADGVLNINGQSIGVWGEFRLISERNASAFGCRGRCSQASYAYKSKYNTVNPTEGIVNGRKVKNDVYRVNTYIYLDGRQGGEEGYKENYYHILVTKRGSGRALKNYLEN